MIKVVDNFLNEAYSSELLNLMQSTHFDWYYNENITYTNKVSSSLNGFGFSHVFYEEDRFRNHSHVFFWKPGLLQILDFVKGKKILRSRADMTTYTSQEFIHDSHVDFEFPNIATIYYVNDSDGDTIFFDKNNNIKSRVHPKKNRLVIFEGNVPHTGSNPTKYKKRILINSNFIK